MLSAAPRRAAIILAVLAILPAFAAAGASAKGDASALAVAEDGRFVVGLVDGVDPAALAEDYGFHGGLIVGTNDAIPFLVVEASDADSFIAAAKTDARVRYVEADLEEAYALLVPNDPSFGTQYAPQKVRLPEAWDTTTGDPVNVAVCVVDSGIRYTHQDLTGRYLGGFDFVNSDADPWDDHGHGTHVAGIAAASIDNALGIAGAAEVGIYATKSLSSAGSGSWSEVANGITWCADNTMPRTVISVSIGGRIGATVVRDAVDYAAITMGKPVVIAAGNGYCADCVSFPGAYDNAITVSCTDAADAPCAFTSTGPEVDVSAPGHNILSTCFDSDSSYCTKSGTSMSTPLVSGALALLWSDEPALTGAQLRARLLGSSVDVGDGGFDWTYGNGRLDAKCLLDGTTPCGAVLPPPAAPPLAPACLDATDGSVYHCKPIPAAFRPISGTGTPIFTPSNNLMTDESLSGAVPIGFSFNHYGNVYTTMTVSSNGYAAFGATVSSFNPQSLPSPTSPNNLVAPYWADLNPTQGNVLWGMMVYKTVGIAPHREFIVEWSAVPYWQFSGLNTATFTTFELILHETTNAIEVQYLRAPSDGSPHVAGTENAAGTTGLRHAFGSFSRANSGFLLYQEADAPVLTALTGVSPGSIDLSWTTPADGGDAITGYAIYRGVNPGVLTHLTDVGVQNAHFDMGLVGGATYYYAVAAINGAGEGDMSNEADAVAATDGDVEPPVPELGTLTLGLAGIGAVLAVARMKRRD